MRLVKIEWVDSFGCETNWTPLDNIADVNHTCISVGFLAKEGKHVTVIVPHYSPGNDKINAVEQGCGEMAIPNISIIKIVDLIESHTSSDN